MVSAFLDINTVVRHLVEDPVEMAKRATAYLTAASALYLTNSVICAESTDMGHVVSSDRAIDRVGTITRHAGG